jgi:drug/metabolite transporter (DMT)-like permease
MFLVMTVGGRVSWSAFTEHVLTNPAAYGLALTAAITWALYSNLARRWSGPTGGGAVELFIPVTGLVLLALRFFHAEPASWNFRAVAEASSLAAVTTVAYMLWDVSMRKGNLLLVAACSYFTPLLSTLVSCLYLKLSPRPQLWLGCFLLVVGSLMTWRSVSDPPLPAATEKH